MSDLAEKVGASAIDELRNYKGFRHWHDDWDSQDVLIDSVGKAAIETVLDELIKEAERDFNNAESGSVRLAQSQGAMYWLKQQKEKLC